MGAGIAKQFLKRFGHQEDLCSMGKKPELVATLRCDQRYVHYLVTKELSNGLPEFHNIAECIDQMFIKCTQLGIKLLALPRISCMRDGQQWERIREEIINKGRNTCITVLVYYVPRYDKPPHASRVAAAAAARVLRSGQQAARVPHQQRNAVAALAAALKTRQSEPSAPSVTSVDHVTAGGDPADAHQPSGRLEAPLTTRQRPR